MVPILYMTPFCPPVRSVLMTAKALGVELNLKPLNLLLHDHLTPEYLKINSQHTVPTLVDDDGFTVWDSHAINYYLITKYGKNSTLLPTDPKKRAIVEQRLHYDTGIIHANYIKIVRPIFRKKYKAIPEDVKVEVLEGVSFLEGFLIGNEWVAGDSLTVADYSLITSITTLDIMVPIIGKAEFPNINRWVKKVKTLPEYSVNVEGLDIFDGIYKSYVT